MASTPGPLGSDPADEAAANAAPASPRDPDPAHSGPAQDVAGSPRPGQDVPGSPGLAQDVPGSPGLAQDAPRSSRRGQDAPRSPRPGQDAPRSPRPGQDAPRSPRRGQDAPSALRVPARGVPGRPAVLTAEDLAAILRGRGRLTDAELDALDRLDLAYLDPDDDPGEDRGEDPDCGPPPEWLTLPPEEQRALLGTDEDVAGLADDPDEDPDPDILDAGFTRHDPAPGATGFAAGGLLDQMLPGADLAWHAGMVRQRGLGTLNDDQLIGFLDAARRLESWSAALSLAATSELDARRAGLDGREGEHVAAEVAVALTLTGRSAQAQLDLSRQLERLPQTAALLAAGIIDRPRALVITAELALLPAGAAAEVENLIAPRAGAMTTGRLRAACQRAVIACDPQAAIRRREQAEKDARVECWAEAAGTAALAGRDLDRARAITADKTLDADARWLQQHGVRRHPGAAARRGVPGPPQRPALRHPPAPSPGRGRG